MATETRETAGLIGSDKAEGTNVYGADREKIGSIERVMINNKRGQVAYAILSFGGFLGMGDAHYPIPPGSNSHTIPISKAIEPISPRRSSKARQNTKPR